MKRVLVISYYFPPDSSIASIRVKGLKKYLSQYGWEAIVLTKNQNDNHNDEENIVRTPYSEYDIIKKVKEKLFISTEKPIRRSITSTKKKESFVFSILKFIFHELIAYPDIHKEWYNHAYDSACDIIENNDVDAIITTSSPIISHLVAYNLKKKYDIPWIADYRDLWTQNHYNEYTFIRKKREKKLEITTISKSDAITTVSKPLAKDLNKLHTDKEIYSIPNGYDPEELFTDDAKLHEKFTITYTGSLYYGKRDPEILFTALNELIIEGSINPDNIDVSFYGPEESWFNNEVEKNNLKGIVNHYGTVPREDAIDMQHKSHLLLLLLWNDPQEAGVYTGKLFEYLASKRPIIAIGPEKSVVKDLLYETSTGYYSSSVKEMKTILKHYYEEYMDTGYVSYNGKGIEKYSHKEMAKQFADVLNKITENNR